MPYVTIQPPFTLKFREMSKKELKDYFQWFLRMMPQRISMLAEAVQQTSGFEIWQPDGTPASLKLLGDWFAAQVETRQQTEEELQEIKNRLVFPMKIPEEELTNKTFSLAMDIGMYFSQVLLKNYPSLRWEQQLNDKKFADYGQPLLVGYGPVPLNPVRIAIVLARCLADKTQTGQRLKELYDIWSKKIAVAWK